MNTIDILTALWFTSISGATFLAFGFDKWRARNSNHRVAESTLVLLAALGGWPGGMLGMIVFNHKTSKWTFKLKYAIALIPFAAEVWAWVRWR